MGDAAEKWHGSLLIMSIHQTAGGSETRPYGPYGRAIATNHCVNRSSRITKDTVCGVSMNGWTGTIQYTGDRVR